jgi:hypothetical protein
VFNVDEVDTKAAAGMSAARVLVREGESYRRHKAF